MCPHPPPIQGSLPAACGLSQRPFAWLPPRLLNSPSIHISHLFHPSSSLSSLPCSHLSCQSNSFPFIVLCPLGSLCSLFVGCPFFHTAVLFFSYLTLFLSLCSFEMSRYIFQFSVFQSGHFTSSFSSVFSFILLSQLYFLPPLFTVSLSLSLRILLFLFIFCPLFKACLILSRPTFQLSCWLLFNYHLSLCSAPFYKIIVPTVDTVRYHYLVKALVSAQHPVLLTGPVGTGKTSVAQSVLQSLDSVTWATLTVNLSSQVMRITFSISNVVNCDLNRSIKSFFLSHKLDLKKQTFTVYSIMHCFQ